MGNGDEHKKKLIQKYKQKWNGGQQRRIAHIHLPERLDVASVEIFSHEKNIKEKEKHMFIGYAVPKRKQE